jgi:hypothetical protein
MMWSATNRGDPDFFARMLDVYRRKEAASDG